MQYGSRPNDTISPSCKRCLISFASRRGFGYSRGIGFQQQCFQYRFVWGIDTLVELPKAGTKVLFSESELKPPDPAIHLASARPARKASSHSRRNALLRRTAPYSTEYAYRRDARRYDKIRQAAVYAGWSHNLRPRAAAFIMTEAVFINQEEADFHTQRGGPAFQQTTFTL